MKNHLSRRTLLCGFGSAAIALPFFEEMMPARALAQTEAPPTRLLTLFFGLGIPREQTLEKFDGPLEAYAPFKDKMAIFTNLELKHAHDFGSGEPHFKTGDVVFVGDPQKKEYEASGPSLEQLAKRTLHPNGVPTKLGSKSIGMWFRTGAVSQYTRHWNFDGSPGERPERRPTTIFEQLFGGAATTQPGANGDSTVDAAELKRQHLTRSVLDAVRDEYVYYSGERSPLGSASRAKLSVHLDNVRTLEQRLVPIEAGIEDAVNQELCVVPDGVVDPGKDVPYDVAQGGAGGSAPVVAHEDFQAAFQLQAELMALALRCDVLRFGSMLFVGAGGHVGFRGTYNALGGSIDFSKDLPGTSSHDAYFHNNRWDRVRLHQHMAQTNLAAVLAALDNQEYLEANGKSVLDNTLVVIGTCYGGGGTTTGHIPEGVFHAIAGGNGHFKPGFNDNVYNVIDLYHTALSPYGIASGMGIGHHPQFRYTPKTIPGLLV
jgi:Protein of unknown function (DUF1552)